ELSGGDVDGADPAAFAGEPGAAAEALQHLAVDRDRAAGREMSLVRIADARFPQKPARRRIERDHARIAGGEEDLVLRDREAAKPAVAGTLLGASALFPDEIAALRIERLHDVVRVEQIEDAVVHERMRLVRAAFRHRPDPRQL